MKSELPFLQSSFMYFNFIYLKLLSTVTVEPFNNIIFDSKKDNGIRGIYISLI